MSMRFSVNDQGWETGCGVWRNACPEGENRLQYGQNRGVRCAWECAAEQILRFAQDDTRGAGTQRMILECAAEQILHFAQDDTKRAETQGDARDRILRMTPEGPDAQDDTLGGQAH